MSKITETINKGKSEIIRRSHHDAKDQFTDPNDAADYLESYSHTLLEAVIEEATKKLPRQHLVTVREEEDGTLVKSYTVTLADLEDLLKEAVNKK